MGAVRALVTAFVVGATLGCHNVDPFTPCPVGQVRVAGVCALAPSCGSLTAGCGPVGESCCSTTPVDGGSFYRGFDKGGPTQEGQPVPGFQSNPGPAAAVQVSPFYLDRYEVSIGRFRAFLAAYDGFVINSLHEGVGADPDRASYAAPDGATTTTGWQDAFGACRREGSTQGCVLSTAAAVVSDIAARCDEPNGMASTGDWTPAPDGRENHPMPCITWYEAMMFCIYDGGRLPTEAEWNFAATTSAQLAFPWSNPASDTTINDTFAAFGALDGAEPVGSNPQGMGVFGQYDLAGNVWEWALDSPSTGADGGLIYGGDSNNPVDFSGLDYGVRAVRGGSFEYPSPDLRTPARLIRNATDRYRDIGARCARPASD